MIDAVKTLNKNENIKKLEVNKNTRTTNKNVIIHLRMRAEIGIIYFWLVC